MLKESKKWECSRLPCGILEGIIWEGKYEY
jgi:hypothetical protein